MTTDRSGDALESLAVAARQLQNAGSVQALLHDIVNIAVTTISACDYAGVSTDHEGKVGSPVVSEPAVLEIDALQYSIGTGPCLLAMRGPDAFVEAPDLEHDERFVPFGTEAAKVNCRAVLAHRLYVDSQTLGSLNLYSRTVNGYTEIDRRRAVVLSAMSSLALNMLRLEIDGEGLREAVQSRDVIGQAKGILMEREGLSADDAFARLRQESQTRNIKLRELAQRLVDERASNT